MLVLGRDWAEVKIIILLSIRTTFVMDDLHDSWGLVMHGRHGAHKLRL